MINYTDIEDTLNRLEREYNSCSETQLSILYSKLAVLELCGWIETSVDTLLKEYIDDNICDDNNKKLINSIIDRNYGFKFKEHIFPMLCSVLGISNVENILDSIPDRDMQNFKTLLGNYAKIRDFAAHNNVEISTTPRYNAPSSVLHDYLLIKPAIQLMENKIKRIKVLYIT